MTSSFQTTESSVGTPRALAKRQRCEIAWSSRVTYACATTQPMRRAVTARSAGRTLHSVGTAAR